MTSEINPRDGKRQPGPDTESRVIPIRELPDIRHLRKAYLRSGDGPIFVDSLNNPIPGANETDFGLTRSSEAEALEFYRESTKKEVEPDELTEFLDEGC